MGIALSFTTDRLGFSIITVVSSSYGQYKSAEMTRTSPAPHLPHCSTRFNNQNTALRVMLPLNSFFVFRIMTSIRYNKSTQDVAVMPRTQLSVPRLYGIRYR